MDDLQRLLERAAPRDIGPAPYDSIVRRGRRRKARARAAALAVPALAALALLAALLTFLPQQPEQPVIDRPPGDPLPEPETDGDIGEIEIEPVPPAPDTPAPEVDDEPAAEDDAPARNLEAFASGSVTVTDLAVELFVVSWDSDDGPSAVSVVTPDGSRQLTSSEPWFGRVSALVPDGLGGFVWQGEPLGQEDGPWQPAPILQTDPDGAQTVAVDPAPHGPEFAPTLVGPDLARDGYLVAQTVIDPGYPDDGSDALPEAHRGDLVSVPWDGDHAILSSDLTAWEHGVTDALNGDGLVYAMAGGAWSGLYVRPPSGEDELVIDGGDATGRWFFGIAEGDRPGTALVLAATPGLPAGGTAGDAEVLVIDLGAGQIVDRFEVPSDVGSAAYAARGIDRTGALLLVNRTTGGDQWLAPLVMNLETGQWAVLEEVEGRTFLSRDLSRS